jgi:hypothetical protein
MSIPPILQYLTDPVADRVNYEDFMEKPFAAFCRQAVNISDAFNHCVRKFPKKTSEEYTKDSLHSMQEIASPLLASLMANLELFQKAVYARLFDLTFYIPDFNTRNLVQNLRATELDISISQIVGYRGNIMAAGNIVADAFTAWHDPLKVNAYFKALLNVEPFYQDKYVDELAVLWQLRHSIVHTGGTLTVLDAQKNESLVSKGGTPIVFRHHVFPAIVIRFHKMLKQVRNSFYPKVTGRFKTAYTENVKKQIDKLFLLESPRMVWLE